MYRMWCGKEGHWPSTQPQRARSEAENLGFRTQDLVDKSVNIVFRHRFNAVIAVSLYIDWHRGMFLDKSGGTEKVPRAE